VINARGLTKRYGGTLAVDQLSFDVQGGVVTGFLGPNGSGKSTTMRMIMGLDAPDEGAVTINAVPYRDLRWPLREVGALLEAKATHPGRSARDHLWAMAQTNDIPRARVDEVLDLVGLHDVARSRAGKFSLGMGQRLGIAAALLGDPGVLLFDEPVNGLDPEGIRWVRNLLRSLAREGRAVFVSSHLMSEMALTADQLVVIGRGRLIAQTSIADFVSANTTQWVRVRSPGAADLAQALVLAGGRVEPGEDGTLAVRELDAPTIGDLAAARGIPLHELTPQSASLEEAFMGLTSDSVEFRGAGLAASGAGHAFPGTGQATDDPPPWPPRSPFAPEPTGNPTAYPVEGGSTPAGTPSEPRWPPPAGAR
jgi:ABC-2 type transport system ATP-binding protein